MRQKIFYVSRDPAHATGWIVSAAAMRPAGFQSRDEALSWAGTQARLEGADEHVIARVLVQEPDGEWVCTFDGTEAAGDQADPQAARR